MSTCYKMHAFLAISVLIAATIAHPQLPKKGSGGPGFPKGGESGGCSPLEIVIARATTESAGYGIVCGPFLKAVQRIIPGTTGYAVKYPADFSNSSPDKGVADVLRYFSTQPQRCPEQKYVLSGYSQGAVVMHRAAVKLEAAILNRIIGAVTFGDGGQQATKEKPIYNSPVGPIPVWPEAFNGKIKFNCAKGDLTCTPGGSSTLAHMTYGSGSYISDSAKFVQQQFKGASSAAGRTQEAWQKENFASLT